MKVTFQHLDTVNLRISDDIILFGRCLDGKSVCVEITSFRPHFVVCVDDVVNVKSWFEKLRLDVWVFQLSSKILRPSTNATTVPNMSTQRGQLNIPGDYMGYVELLGQDIVHYQESGPKRFVRIHCKDKWVSKRARRFLSSPEPLKYVYQQFYTQEGDVSLTRKTLKRKNDAGYPLQHVALKFPNRRVYTVFNDQVDLTLQYLIGKDIYSCSFLEVNGIERAGSAKRSTCDIELIGISSLTQVAVDGIAPWRILSYDIESVPHSIPHRPGKFSFPTPWEDPVCTIGVALQVGNVVSQYVWILNGMSTDRRPLATLDPLVDPPDAYRPEETTVRCFDDELDMVQDFFNFVVTQDVDFIEGHNINRFDNTYMLDRYCMLRNRRSSERQTLSDLKAKRHEFTKPTLGRLIGYTSHIVKQTFSSSQKGSHEKFKLFLPGRIVLDSYDIMKDQHNESSYKLDNLAAKYLGTKKIEQDYNEIPRMFRSQKGRHDLAVYCIKDSWLVRKMMDKLCKLTVLLQMANVTGISMKDVIERGQGIRTMGLMLRYCKRRQPEYFIPRVVREETTAIKKVYDMQAGEYIDKEVVVEPESFEGAVVVDPDVGFYIDAVSCLDFASLYPSIMRALNMSYETLVSRQTIIDREWREDHEVRTIPDFEYVNKQLKVTKPPENVTFVTADVRRGLLPEMLETILIERKAVKEKMKAHDPSSTMYRVLDGRQLSLKVVANSMYGFTGASVGFLPEKRIASSVTKYGRYMINQTKNAVENHPEWGKRHGCKCIYGDSVSGNTPLLIRRGQTIHVVAIKNLDLSEDTYTWTEKGWTKIQNIVKHRLAKHKKMLQINTHGAIVHCTNDHSLVLNTGMPISPDDIQIGTKLMHSYPSEFPGVTTTLQHAFERCFMYKGVSYPTGKAAADAHSLKTQPRAGHWEDIPTTIVVDERLARVMGMFMGDGSCGTYACTSGKKSSWAINNADLELLEEYKELCSVIFTHFEFIILPTVNSYKLIGKHSQHGAVSKFVAFWRNLLYTHDREKKVPDIVLNSPKDIRLAFLQGLHDADGTKSIKHYEISQKGHESCAGIYYLLRSVGYDNIVVDARADKPSIFRLRPREKVRNPMEKVKTITEIPYEEWVYDLTTENHHFHAGIGNMIVHNTDSVFVHMPRSLVNGKTEEELMTNAHAQGEVIAREVTKIFLPPNDLEYEKSYSSFLLLKKKRYAGHKFEPGHPPKLQIKGLEAARRDYAPLLVDTQKRMLNILLLERNIQKACDFVAGVVFDLMNNRTDLEQLIMSKKLSQAPKAYKAMAAHVVLALRLEKETPDKAPVSGDRVDYVICNNGRQKVSESACLPSEVESGKYTVDTKYYLEKQLKGPLLRILEKVVRTPEDLFLCNKVFKPSVKRGMMAAFSEGSERAAESNATQLSRKKMKPLRDTKKRTLLEMFKLQGK